MLHLRWFRLSVRLAVTGEIDEDAVEEVEEATAWHELVLLHLGLLADSCISLSGA